MVIRSTHLGHFLKWKLNLACVVKLLFIVDFEVSREIINQHNSKVVVMVCKKTYTLKTSQSRIYLHLWVDFHIFCIKESYDIDFMVFFQVQI